MKGYGQFCPIAKASEILGERWTHLIIRELGAGSETFNDLRRGMPLISPTLLSARLRSLEHHELIQRDSDEKGVRYALTDAGKELKPIILAVGTWGHRWVRSELNPEDLDPSMLMWDIHRTMNADYFGGKRTVLLFEFEDYTSRFRRWWLLINKGEVDVCMKDPGHDIDLQVLTDLKTLTGIWMGDFKLTECINKKLLRMTGPNKLKRDIKLWLGKNYFSDVKNMR